jgi:predicted DNA-binding transcriptional regulator YafY
MPSTLYRQWLMLKAIPRFPRKVDAATIERKIEDQGITIHRRTIQRDLMALSGTFPIVCDDVHKPYGWSWSKDAQVQDLPNMDPHLALTFRLVQDFLKPLVPHATFGALDSHFKRANEVLSSLPGSGLRDWPEKVRVVPTNQPLITAEIKDEVLSAIYDGLLQKRRVLVTYKRRGEKKAKSYEINPQGLVFKGGVIYLVCAAWDYEDVIQLALHRVVKATLLETPSLAPEDFDLDEYIEAGEFSFPLSAKPIKLRARFHKDAAIHLHETPLSEDQKISRGKGDYVTLSATVVDSLLLRGWLRSFGALVEVLSPATLRESFSDQAKKVAKLYS